MRDRWVALVASLLVLSLAVVSVYVRGGSTAVDLDDVIERYRVAEGAEGPASTPDPEATAGPSREGQSPEPAETGPVTGIATDPQATVSRPRPVAGVYVYATSGGESVDVLGGASHTYPDRTTITYRHAGCGLIERWDALEERWDERETCPTSTGDRLKRTTAYHEFFRQGDVRTLTCDEQTYAWPGSNEPGTTWTGRCSADNTQVLTTGRVVGEEIIEVEGTPVRTLHVRVDAEVSGSQTGTSRNDVWGAFDTGLVIKQVSSTSTRGREPVVGEVSYQESYELLLTSLEPRG